MTTGRILFSALSPLTAAEAQAHERGAAPARTWPAFLLASIAFVLLRLSAPPVFLDWLDGAACCYVFIGWYMPGQDRP